MTAGDDLARAEADACREQGYLTMKDGVRLAYVVWRPKRVGRYPTLVNYSTYVESGAPFKTIRRYLDAGYAYVGANVRGTGSSEGTFSYYQPIEGEDGAEIVEWAAAQSWSTGSVGMVGSSYGGHTQIKVAACRPPHLRAIVPVATEGSEYHDEGRTGGLFNAALMAHWAFRVQPDRARAGVENRGLAGDTECARIHADQPTNPAYDEVLRHPLYDDWWRARTLDEMASRVVVPTLLIHGWQDEWIRPNGALRLFKALGVANKALLLQNGPHTLIRYSINQAAQIRWLDRWVKGESNGVDAEPAVRVLWEVTEPEDDRLANASWETSYATWPPPATQWVTLYLTAGGEFSHQRPAEAVDHGVRSYVYPLGTELVGSNQQFALAPHPLGTLSYRTQPMVTDVAVLGMPQLRLFFSSDQTDTDFMVTLKDIDPSGNILFLQRSVLRASLRAIDAARSTPDEIIQSFTRSEVLEPGRIYEIRLSLSALGHVVRRGHRLELSILAPSPIPNPVWGFVPTVPAVNRIYHSAGYPTSLHLPILPGQQAPKPAPRLGALRNQPYRPAPPSE